MEKKDNEARQSDAEENEKDFYDMIWQEEYARLLELGYSVEVAKSLASKHRIDLFERDPKRRW